MHRNAFSVGSDYRPDVDNASQNPWGRKNSIRQDEKDVYDFHGGFAASALE
ncbi:MAG TPA: hypothetical protein VK581_10400 [Chthoniobacterales bacterium]|nr:hypothetical protein [Chthoniobacterales bacterium]